MTTTPNLLGSYLTGAILTAVRHYEMNHSSACCLLATLETAHLKFPSMTSEEVLKEIAELRQRLERELHELHAEERRRDELERFRDLDGDHEYERAERGPEHEYPR